VFKTKREHSIRQDTHELEISIPILIINDHILKLKITTIITTVVQDHLQIRNVVNGCIMHHLVLLV
jgi:hypothetical protein